MRLNDNILTSKVIRIDSLFPTIFRVGGGTLLEMNSEITEHSTTIIFSPSSSTSLPKVENLCEDISINLQQKYGLFYIVRIYYAFLTLDFCTTHVSLFLPVDRLEHGWAGQLEHGWAGQLEQCCWQACSCMLEQTVRGLMNEQTWTTLLEPSW